MAKQPCAIPGCEQLVERGYCTQHKPKVKPYDRWRGTAASRGYDADWVKVKNQSLKRDGFMCVKHRKLGQMVKAEAVDHVIPVSSWPEGRLLLSNTESLCRSCHSAKTWAERKGTAGTGG